MVVPPAGDATSNWKAASLSVARKSQQQDTALLVARWHAKQAQREEWRHGTN